MAQRRSPFVTALFLVLLAAAGHVLAYYIIKVPSQLELVVLTAVIFSYPIARSPLTGLYCIFIIAPFIPYIRRLYYLAYARPDTDPLIMLAEIFLLFILMGLFFEFRDRVEKDRPIRFYTNLALFYFAYMALRTVFYTDVPISRGIQLFKFYGIPVLFFFVAIIYADQLRHMLALWYLTLALSIICALYGIFQLYVGYSRAEQLWFASISFTTLFIKGIARPFSTFQAPAAFADFCQLGIIAVLMALEWMRKPIKIVLIAAIGVLTYAILITSVRSNWIGLLATFPLWFVVLKIKGTRNRIIAITASLCVFIGYNFISEMTGNSISITDTMGALAGQLGNEEIVDMLVADRTSAISNPFEEHSFLSRMALWRYLLVLAQEPVLAFMGRGVGALKADSLYFTYLAEFGYPGVFLILLVFFVFIKQGIRAIDTHPDPAVVTLARGVTVMNIIFALISITGTHIHSFPGDLYFWFWNGVVIKLCSQPSAATDPLALKSAYDAR